MGKGRPQRNSTLTQTWIAQLQQINKVELPPTLSPSLTLTLLTHNLF